MSRAWIIQQTKTGKGGETFVEQATTVYADDQIEATRQGIAMFGRDITVTAIGDDQGGRIPTDAELLEVQREAREAQVAPEVADEMRSTGGSAYG